MTRAGGRRSDSRSSSRPMSAGHRFDETDGDNMDLGIKGKKALVCASSRGLGLACATALAREGCDVYINGRNRDALESAAAEIEAVAGRRPHIVVADLNTEEGRAALIEACTEPDILINNNAGPEPGKISDWSRDDWLGAVEGNMLAPIFLIKA